jgi:hypothetical protein
MAEKEALMKSELLHSVSPCISHDIQTNYFISVIDKLQVTYGDYASLGAFGGITFTGGMAVLYLGWRNPSLDSN